jgi:hypothetical protein
MPGRSRNAWKTLLRMGIMPSWVENDYSNTNTYNTTIR